MSLAPLMSARAAIAGDPGLGRSAAGASSTFAAPQGCATRRLDLQSSSVGSSYEDLLEVVDRIYAAAVDPEHWTEALKRMQALLGASAAAVELHDNRSKDVLLIRSTGLPPDGVRKYQDYYHLVCPRLRGSRVGEVDYDYKFFREADMDRDEFYADFLAPDGFRYYAYSTVLSDAHVWGACGVHRSPAEGHVDQDEIDKLVALGPHIQRALQIHLRLTGLESRARSFAEGLDRLRQGVALLDARGELTFLNRAAEALLARRTGVLHVERRRLRARRRDDEARLRKVVAAAVGPTLVVTSGGGVLVFADDDGPLSLLVAPLPRSHGVLAERVVAGARAVVFLSDGARGLDARQDLLRVAFGFTTAEARLAMALLAGATLAEHAERARIRFTTARSHYAHLRAKLGATNEADVIRRLVALLPDVS